MTTAERHQENWRNYFDPVNYDLYDDTKLHYGEAAVGNYSQDPNPELFVGLSDEMKHFYEGTKYWIAKWHTLPHLDFHLEGSINLLPLEKIVHFDEKTFLADENPVMRGFRLLDYFYNEAAIGFYIHAPERGLYYFEFDGETEPLHLGFKGYMELLCYTRGVGYWQLMILAHLTHTSRANVSSIREHLPKLFPDFSYEEFIERYEAVRIPSFS